VLIDERVIEAPVNAVVESKVIPPLEAGVAHSGAVAPELTCNICHFLTYN
jgi:hypothetical protein